MHFHLCVRRLQVMILLWELCALVGFVTQVGWNYDLKFQGNKASCKNCCGNNPWAWVFFTFTCLPLQNVILLLGFPRLPDRLCSPTDLPEVSWFPIFFLQNPEWEVIKNYINQITTQLQWCHGYYMFCMPWIDPYVCIGEMLWCVVPTIWSSHRTHICSND